MANHSSYTSIDSNLYSEYNKTHLVVNNRSFMHVCYWNIWSKNFLIGGLVDYWWIIMNLIRWITIASVI